MCVLQKSCIFLKKFQAETLSVCPKHGKRTKFQLEILTTNVISGIVYFRDIILESSRNISETNPLQSRDTSDWKAVANKLSFVASDNKFSRGPLLIIDIN